MIYRNVLALTAFVALFFASCSPATTLTATWSGENAASYDLERVAVLGLSGQKAYGGRFEAQMVSELQEEGINAVPSSTILPADFDMRNSSREEVVRMLNEQGVDGVMVFSILDIDDESYYVAGETYYQPDYYYNNFYDYYARTYDVVYDPGYYVDAREYFIETNVYDVVSTGDKLIYSAQSRTFDPNSLENLADSVSDEIVDDLEDENII